MSRLKPKRRPHSPETRAKMSASLKGRLKGRKRTFSAAHRAALSAALTGRKLTKQHRAKIAAATKGVPKRKRVSPADEKPEVAMAQKAGRV
jgi:hypothetical protein